MEAFSSGLQGHTSVVEDTEYVAWAWAWAWNEGREGIGDFSFLGRVKSPAYLFWWIWTLVGSRWDLVYSFCSSSMVDVHLFMYCCMKSRIGSVQLDVGPAVAQYHGVSVVVLASSET